MKRNRVHVCLRFFCAVAVAFALLQWAPAPLAGQATTAATNADSTLNTPWGEPDLQGIWTRDVNIPLQRPARYADREFLTDPERAELDRRVSGILGRASTEARRRRGNSEKDVTGAYNQAVFTSHLRVGRRTSLIVDPPDGRIPPLTAEAQKRRETLRAFQLALLQATPLCKNKERGCAGGTYVPTPSPRRAEAPPFYLAGGAAGLINRSDAPEDRSLGERCMQGAPADSGGFRRIVQTPGGISILYDTGGGQAWQRNIPITTAAHLPSNIRQWWGDPRGRWEGRTLVVDTTNFSPKPDFQGSRENLHVVERWTRLDADTIEWAVTLEDPTVWTRPWTFKQEMKKQSDQANRIYFEPRCHEGNYGLIGLLRGARSDEAAFLAGRGPDPATRCTTDADCGGFAGGFADDGEDSNPFR